MKQKGNRPASPEQSQTQNPMQPANQSGVSDRELEEQEEEESGSRQEDEEESTSIGQPHPERQQKSQYPNGGSRDT